jgi:hypothetical protein
VLGRLYQQYRPDFVLRDDLENAFTIESPVVTEKIVKLLDEARGGMATYGSALTLNLINDLLPTEWVKTGELLRFHADFKGFLVNSPVTG